MTAFRAMDLARRLHASQLRKYTGNPYADHLGEVAGIVAATITGSRALLDAAVSVAWLHDSIEDQGITRAELSVYFGDEVAAGVQALTDSEAGSRAQRKAAAVLRVAAAPGWVQTVKVADLMSNTSSIVKHDPAFARVYLPEKAAMLQALTKADPGLLRLAGQQLNAAMRKLEAITVP